MIRGGSLWSREGSPWRCTVDAHAGAFEAYFGAVKGPILRHYTYTSIIFFKHLIYYCGLYWNKAKNV
jgi:hypothetical protein